VLRKANISITLLSWKMRFGASNLLFTERAVSFQQQLKAMCQREKLENSK